MFYVLRQIERWLQQHIFKVGWLLTKDFKITTILYYTFFSPGILVYEMTYWLVAGMLDVHAERSIAWPESQQIGELRLNFVRLSRRTTTWKLFVINIAPLLTGILLIWFVVTGVFHVYDVFDQISAESTGTYLQNFSSAIGHLTATPDFWFWVWIIFAVSNTMLPDPGALKGWRWLAGAVVLLSIPLFLLGVGDRIVGQAIAGPVATAINLLSIIFGTMIVVDVVIVAILGTIESVIERITGNSATFKNGRMIVMTRAEAIAQRRQDIRRERTRRKREQRAPAAQSGPPSVYKLAFPIPGPPGDEPISQQAASILGTDERPAIGRPTRPRREEPDVIPSEASRINPPSRSTDEIRFSGQRNRATSETDTVSDDVESQDAEDSLLSRSPLDEPSGAARRPSPSNSRRDAGLSRSALLDAVEDDEVIEDEEEDDDIDDEYEDLDDDEDDATL